MQSGEVQSPAQIRNCTSGIRLTSAGNASSNYVIHSVVALISVSCWSSRSLQGHPAVEAWINLWQTLHRVQHSAPQLQHVAVETPLNHPLDIVSSSILSSLALLPQQKLLTLDFCTTNRKPPFEPTPLILSTDASSLLPSLTALQALHIGRFGNQFNGPDCASAPLSSLACLSNLSCLTKLVLLQTATSNEVAALLQGLPQLRELHLDLLRFQDPDPIGNVLVVDAISAGIADMENLVHLSVIGGEHGTLDGLSGLTKLTHLTWRSHLNLPLPEGITALTGLVELCFSDVPASSRERLLTGLTNLRHLDIDVRRPDKVFNPVMFQVLQGLPKLTYLALRDQAASLRATYSYPQGPVAPAGIAGLAALTMLTGLRLDGINLSQPPALLPMLRIYTSLTGLRELGLNKCRISDIHVATISGWLSQLTRLDLEGNSIKNPGIETLVFLKKLRGLQQLGLRGTAGMCRECQAALPEHFRLLLSS